MKMPELLRRLLPGCEAEKLLEQNERLSKDLSERLVGTVEDVTTIFDRRGHPNIVIPIAERRKA